MLSREQQWRPPSYCTIAAGSILAAPPAPVLSVIVQKAGGAAAPSLIMIGELTLALAAAGYLLGDGGCCKMLKAWQANKMDAIAVRGCTNRRPRLQLNIFYSPENIDQLPSATLVQLRRGWPVFYAKAVCCVLCAVAAGAGADAVAAGADAGCRLVYVDGTISPC